MLSKNLSFEDNYPRVDQFLAANSPKTVVIQSENEFINDAVKLIKYLKKTHPDINFYMSADNSKNECCVDTNAAQHITWDLIIKIGESCYSENYEQKKKILYLPKKLEIDFDSLRKGLKDIQITTPALKVY